MIFDSLGYDQARRIYDREVERPTGHKLSTPLKIEQATNRNVGFTNYEAITYGYILADVCLAAKVC